MRTAKTVVFTGTHEGRIIYFSYMHHRHGIVVAQTQLELLDIMALQPTGVPYCGSQQCYSLLYCPHYRRWPEDWWALRTQLGNEDVFIVLSREEGTK